MEQHSIDLQCYLINSLDEIPYNYNMGS